tara:strand:- start:345 stop:458 length:114 start_codon:yes stop_codon:yes gene_type:complete
MTKVTKKPINWRTVYIATFVWLLVLIVLMRLLTKAYS